MDERRRFPRTRISERVMAKTDRGRELQVVDASVRGVRVLSARPLRPGQSLHVKMEDWPLELGVVVRRSRAVAGQGGYQGIAYEAGLELTELDEATETAIKAHLLNDETTAHQRGGIPEEDSTLVRAG